MIRKRDVITFGEGARHRFYAENSVETLLKALEFSGWREVSLYGTENESAWNDGGKHPSVFVVRVTEGKGHIYALGASHSSATCDAVMAALYNYCPHLEISAESMQAPE